MAEDNDSRIYFPVFARQRSKQIHEAFIRHGFKKDTRTFSIDGKPAIGHYIAILDNPKGKEGTGYHSFHQIAKKKVFDYVELLVSENIEGADALKTNLEEILQE